jgi:hypothetical protein
MSEPKYKVGDVLSHTVFSGQVVVIAVLDDKEYRVRTSDLREVTVFEWELGAAKDEEKKEYLTEDRL